MESLIYYAAYNPETGKYKAQRTCSHETTYDMSKITLYKSKETAEKYGKRYGCRLLEKGVDIRTVQELLGHSDIRMTERYTHTNKNIKYEAVSLL